jgi:hypothetical protein
MGVNRSSFYKWKHRLEHPSKRMQSFVADLILFKEYHAKYPSHGYRWLNAKIRLDTGLVVSDQYAHKCCKTAGIVSDGRLWEAVTADYFRQISLPDRAA